MDVDQEIKTLEIQSKNQSKHFQLFKSANVLDKYPSILGGASLNLVVDTQHPIIIEPLESKTISTGLMIRVDDSYHIQIQIKLMDSLISEEKDFSIFNPMPEFCENQKLEIKVILYNHSKQRVIIEPFEKFAEIAFLATPSHHHWYILE